MASSSRPFQSQTISRLLAGYRHFAHGAGQWWRQGRTALVWGVQVALYPAYVGVQSLRLASRRLKGAKPWQPFVARLTGARLPSLAIESDTPIRALLSITQPQIVRQPGGRRYVDRHGQFLRQSRAERELTPGQWSLLPLQVPVRGIASDLVTRQLVLVTAGNTIFTGLTAAQQGLLQRAILLLLAEYASVCRRKQLDQQLKGQSLPLPQGTPTQWPLVRYLHRGMGWMQSSPLAIATNLFGEADVAQRILNLTHSPSTTVPSQAPEWMSLAPALQGGIQFPQRFSPGAMAPFGTRSAGRSQTLVIETSHQPLTAWPAIGSASLQGSPPEIHRFDAPVSPWTAVAPPPLSRELAAGDGMLQLPAVDAIDAQVTLIHYVDHPLVVVLRGLDALIHTLETWLRNLWQWLIVHI